MKGSSSFRSDEAGRSHYGSDQLTILQIIGSLDPKDGGTVAAVRTFESELKKRGEASHILCMDAPESAWLSPTQAVTATGSRSAYRFSLSSLKWLWAHGREYDLVLVHGLWQFPTLLALLNSLIRKQPYFVFVHGMLDPWFKTQYPAKHVKKTVYWWLIEGWALRRASAVVFTCEAERRLAEGAFRPYRVRSMISPVAADDRPDQRELTRQKSTFVERHPELADKQVILFLGRLHEKKGCDLLIQAFASLHERHRDVHLVIAGPDDGVEGSKLRRLASDLGVAARVTWTGHLSNDEKWGALSAADVFCLPSHQENFGIAVAEALACGTPVLVSTKVNIWEEVVAARCGLAAEDTVSGVTKLIESWLSLDISSQHEMSTNARRFYETSYTGDAATSTLVNGLRSRLLSPPTQ